MNEMIIGMNIEKARKEMGFSQVQFAQILGVSQQAVALWEKGERTPDVITLGKIAQVLNKDLNYFLYSSPQPQKITIQVDGEEYEVDEDTAGKFQTFKDSLKGFAKKGADAAGEAVNFGTHAAKGFGVGVSNMAKSAYAASPEFVKDATDFTKDLAKNASNVAKQALYKATEVLRNVGERADDDFDLDDDIGEFADILSKNAWRDSTSGGSTADSNCCDNTAGECCHIEPTIILSSGGENIKIKKGFRSLSMETWKDIDFSDMSDPLGAINMATVRDCDFSSRSLTDLSIKMSTLRGCIFVGASLTNAKFSMSNIKGSDFSGASLTGAKADMSTFTNNNLSGASLLSANIGLSTFSDNNLSGADFTGATFSLNSLKDTDFSNATLNRTSFDKNTFSDVTFGGEIKNCNFTNNVYKDVLFNNATFTNCFFKGKKKHFKSIKFVNCKADKASYEFLKNLGITLNGITQI